MLKAPRLNSKHNQQAVVLVSSLVFLLVITLVSINSMQTAVLETKMATNMYQYNLVFQQTEKLLQRVENRFKNKKFVPVLYDDEILPEKLTSDEWSKITSDKDQECMGSTVDCRYAIQKFDVAYCGDVELVDVDITRAITHSYYVVTVRVERYGFIVKLQSSLACGV